MASTISTILDNLKTALEGITLANDYNTDVKTVERFPLPIDEAIEKVPYIAIIEGGDTLLVTGETNILFKREITLNALLKADVDLPQKINKFETDIKKLIYSPVDLGTYCKKIIIVASDTQITDTEDIALVSIALEIIYYAPKASF